MRRRGPRADSLGTELAAIAFVAMAAASVRADVVTDGSLGPQGPVPKVGNEYQIGDALGRYSSNGRALVHSFSQFQVAFGDEATFSATMGTPRFVVARDTGGARSGRKTTRY